MTVAEASPNGSTSSADRHDRAFLGHPKGLGFLAFVEGCERFQLLLDADAAVAVHGQLSAAARRISSTVAGLGWLQRGIYRRR